MTTTITLINEEKDFMEIDYFYEVEREVGNEDLLNFFKNVIEEKVGKELRYLPTTCGGILSLVTVYNQLGEEVASIHLIEEKYPQPRKYVLNIQTKEEFLMENVTVVNEATSVTGENELYFSVSSRVGKMDSSQLVDIAKNLIFNKTGILNGYFDDEINNYEEPHFAYYTQQHDWVGFFQCQPVNKNEEVYLLAFRK